MELCHSFDTEIGIITIEIEDGFITRLEMGAEKSGASAMGSDLLAPVTTGQSARRSDPVALVPDSRALLLEAERQIHEYFAGERKTFDLPLAPAGTPFQEKIWNALLEIPYGCTDTYGGIAAKTGNPKAARAVGMANNRNPIPIIIPCHRVIGSDGSLVGYGSGLDIKIALLQKEGVLHRHWNQ